MKKMLCILNVSLFLAIFLIACGKKNSYSEMTELTTSSETIETLLTTTNIFTTSSAPIFYANPSQYVNGSIPLEEDWELELPYSKLHYRNLFYNVPGRISSLVSDEEFVNWSQNFRANLNGNEPKEMKIAAFVKHFNISRERFDEANQHLISAWTRTGIANKSELYEIPNADIIYTFDNEIINDYYRRE